MAGYGKIARDGLWENNIVFSQLLALCPLLAVTGTATNGLGMGLASTAVLVASGFAVSVLRKAILPDIRIPVFVLLIAAIVTMVDQALNAWLHELHRQLGLFIPLIVTNCAILGRAEAFASKTGPLKAGWDGLMMGIGFTLALVVLGGIREIAGSGTLFAGADVLLGPAFAWLEITVLPGYGGFLLLILPPGGFLVLGALLALKAAFERHQTNSARAPSDAAAAHIFTAVGVLHPEPEEGEPS